MFIKAGADGYANFSQMSVTARSFSGYAFSASCYLADGGGGGGAESSSIAVPFSVSRAATAPSAAKPMTATDFNLSLVGCEAGRVSDGQSCSVCGKDQYSLGNDDLLCHGCPRTPSKPSEVNPLVSCSSGIISSAAGVQQFSGIYRDASDGGSLTSASQLFPCWAPNACNAIAAPALHPCSGRMTKEACRP
jgi:hypothetical protein